MIEDDEDRLIRLLRASVVPLEKVPQGDVWPAVLSRIHERPRLSRADGGLLGALFVLGLLFPQSVLFLFYCL